MGKGQLYSPGKSLQSMIFPYLVEKISSEAPLRGFQRKELRFVVDQKLKMFCLSFPEKVQIATSAFARLENCFPSHDEEKIG